MRKSMVTMNLQWSNAIGDIGGGKVLKQATLKAKNRVAAALRTAANTLLRSDRCLVSRFRSLRTRRGAQQFENKRVQRELSALQRKAAAHGFKLVNLEVSA